MTFVKDNILNIDIKLPTGKTKSTFTSIPATFNAGGKKFSAYTEATKMKEALYKMMVSIYTEDK